MLQKSKQGDAPYGFVQNLVKASRLQPSRVRQFSHSKLLYTKFNLAKRIFKRMMAVARFKNEIYRIDLAYVDKLPKGCKVINSSSRLV